MENKSTMSRAIDNASQATQQVAETMADTIVQVIDRLAGKKSDLKLTFDNLTFDVSVFSAKLNGAIVLDVIMAADAGTAVSS